MKNFQLILFVILFATSNFIVAQVAPTDQGEKRYSIIGKVTDAQSGSPILFGSVALYKDGVIVDGTETDIDGNYIFKLKEEGIYDVEVSYVGYAPSKISGVKVHGVIPIRQDLELNQSILLNEVTIIEYKEPLVKFDKTTSSSTVTADQIRNLPTKNISAVASTMAGIRTKRQSKRNAKREQALNAEEYSNIVENKFQRTTTSPLSTFSIDVDRAAYSNVRRFINMNQMPPHDAVRVEEMINYFSYDYELPESEEVFNVEHNLTTCPWNPKNQILHVGLQGMKIEEEVLPPTNLVFLVDVSGSMSAYNKLDLVKTSLTLLVDKMRPQDRIALVAYAGAAGLVLESTSGSEKLKIKAAINNLSSGGSTAGGAGIYLAYKVAKENFISKGNNRVILATDGDFNIGVSSEGSLVDLIETKRDDDIFLSVLGFGVGNYKDNKMQSLADSGNGNHAYIDGEMEAKKTLINEFGGTLFTIAKDVKIQIEFNPEYVKEYKLIGYENRMLNKEDFNNDKVDAGELGEGHTVTALYEIVPASRKRNESASVDDLKYQEFASVNNQSDLATIKLRYKKPKGTKSKKVEEIISPILKQDVSSEIQFALCVAEFGLLLRESKAIKKGSYEDLLNRAKDIAFINGDEYRDEFIGLLEKVVAMKTESEE